MIRHRCGPLLAAAVFAAAVPLAHADDTYVGLNANWSDPAAWSNSAPALSTDNVFVTPTITDGSTNTLTLDTPANVASLTLGATSNGTAVLNLANHTLTAGSTTILATGQLTGSGNLTSNFTNAGTVTTTGTTTLYLPTNSVAVNNGTLTAAPGGDLALHAALNEGSSATVNNTNGLITAVGTATSLSVVEIAGVAIQGGQLTTNTYGTLKLGDSAVLDNTTLSGNLLLAAQVAISNSTISAAITDAAPGQTLLYFSGHIVNNGNLDILTYFRDATTFDGNGTISPSKGVFPGLSSSTLSIGANQTVHGAGSIPNVLTMAGTVLADDPSRSTSLSGANNSLVYLSGTMTASGAFLTYTGYSVDASNGTFSAIAGARFSFSGSSTVANANTLFRATGAASNGTPSNLSLTNTSLLGGTISTDSTGVVFLSNTTLSNVSLQGNLVCANATLANLALAGNLVSSNNTFNYVSNITLSPAVNLTGPFYVSGTIINNTTATLSGTGYLTAIGNQTTPLLGTGSIILNGAGLGPNLIIPSSQSISGYGALSAVQMNASINANVTSQFLYVSGGTSITNNGNLTATNGGILDFTGSTLRTLDNSNGTISAIGASATNIKSVVAFNASPPFTLTGGTLFTDATGSIALNNTTLSSAQLTGNFTGNGPLLSNDTLTTTFATKGTMFVAGTLTDNATWSNATIRFNDSVLINGSGSILLLGGSLNPGKANNSLVTLGTGITLKGYGAANTLTANGSLTFINNGTITADADPTAIGASTPHTFSIPLIIPLTNAGILSAVANATLQLSSAAGSSIDNTSGHIIATGGTVSLSNLTITGGSISSTSGGGVSFLNTNTLGNLSLSGNLTAGGPLTFTGTVISNATLVSNSTLALPPGAAFTSSGVSTVQSVSLPAAASYNQVAGALIVNDPSTLSSLQNSIAAGTLFTSALNSALMLLSNANLPVPFTTFAGQPVNANALLVAPELLGDATLDGHVDLNDLNIVLNDLGQSTPNWTAGNFDNAATIDLNDLNAVLNNLGTSYATNATVEYAQSLLPASTPEPTTLALFVPFFLLTSRRKSH